MNHTENIFRLFQIRLAESLAPIDSNFVESWSEVSFIK